MKRQIQLLIGFLSILGAINSGFTQSDDVSSGLNVYNVKIKGQRNLIAMPEGMIKFYSVDWEEIGIKKLNCRKIDKIALANVGKNRFGMEFISVPTSVLSNSNNKTLVLNESRKLSFGFEGQVQYATTLTVGVSQENRKIMRVLDKTYLRPFNCKSGQTYILTGTNNGAGSVIYFLYRIDQ